MSGLRVAHVTATFPPYLGGAGTTAFHLADGLARRGHDVEVFTAAAPGSPPPSTAAVHRLRPRVAIGNAPLLPVLARLRGFDVIHLHLPFIFGAELILAGRLRDRRTPLVVTFHNLLVGDGLRRPLFAGYEAVVGRAIVRAADRVCVVSDAHAASVPALRALPAERTAVVPNGVDVDAFSPPVDRDAIRAAMGLPPGVPVAAFVATLDRAHFLKRADVAIQAAALAGVENLHLLVAGDGEWRARIEAQGRASGLGERVRFLGAVPHERLPSVLGCADFLLLSSDLESFGIVLIEALACGVPVVASDLPGVRAVVREGVDGLLAPAGAAEGFAERIRAMVELTPEQRARMGAEGRARCVQEFAWPQIVERVEEVYGSVPAP